MHFLFNSNKYSGIFYIFVPDSGKESQNVIRNNFEAEEHMTVKKKFINYKAQCVCPTIFSSRRIFFNLF